MIARPRTWGLLVRRMVPLALGAACLVLLTNVQTTALPADAAGLQVTSPMKTWYPMPAGWTLPLQARVQSSIATQALVALSVWDKNGAYVYGAGQSVQLQPGTTTDTGVDWTIPPDQPAGTYTLAITVYSPSGVVLGSNQHAYQFQTAPAKNGSSSGTGQTVSSNPTPSPTPTATAMPTLAPTQAPTPTTPPTPSPSPTAVPVVSHVGSAAPDTGTATSGAAIPQRGQPCPTWVHDRYTTTGPDGKPYPTWHPPVDPDYGCLFGHEHGADPRLSNANNTLPAFGYAAATMGMVEPHAGFKVFIINAGQPVESNVDNKISDQDVRLVFHMGTSGPKRFTEPMHSMQYDVIDHTNWRQAHVYGMADTGSLDDAGSTCNTPRKGHKDFSTLGCGDTYEIWNAVRFQILADGDEDGDLTNSRFGVVPSVAVFDPITSRDPNDSQHVVYTENVKPNPAYVQGVDPSSPLAFFQGCRREFYSGPAFWNNINGATTYWTDAFGHVAPNNRPDASHPIQQTLSADRGYRGVIFKFRQDFCGNGIHAPN